MARAVASSGDESASVRWYRAAAVGFSLVFVMFATWAYIANRFWPVGADFVSFWAAGRLALAGTPQLAYDISAHHAAEQAAGHVTGLLPFPYPPPFLGLVTLFAVVPFGPSFYLWVAGTAAFCAWSARRLAPPEYLFAIPSSYTNLLTGQTGFLITGIFIAGLGLIEASPWWAGGVLGLLALKPQLALLLPVATLAGREWRVIGGATLSVLALVLFSLALFGTSTWQAFFGILPHYLGFIRTGMWSWNELASVFALGRFVGLSPAAALSIHAGVAIASTLMTARAWWLKLDSRVPILAAATLLASPYLLTYDAVLLAVPIAWLIRQGRHPPAAAAAWLCGFTPVLTYLSRFPWPNLVPVGALICLAALHMPLSVWRLQSPRASRAAT